MVFDLCQELRFPIHIIQEKGSDLRQIVGINQVKNTLI